MTYQPRETWAYTSETFVCAVIKMFEKGQMIHGTDKIQLGLPKWNRLIQITFFLFTLCPLLNLLQLLFISEMKICLSMVVTNWDHIYCIYLVISRSMLIHWFFSSSLSSLISCIISPEVMWWPDPPLSFFFFSFTLSALSDTQSWYNKRVCGSHLLQLHLIIAPANCPEIKLWAHKWNIRHF